MTLSELPIPPPRERWAQRKSRIVRFFVREKFWRRFPASSSRSTPAAARPTNIFFAASISTTAQISPFSLDGMPLNLPSHAHGEGYADMNTVIPEFVQRVNFEKGPYYADVGNYGSAGSAHVEFFKTLPQNFFQVEGGMYGYGRAVFGVSHKLGSGNLLFGGEVYHDDGPWKHPDDY